MAVGTLVKGRSALGKLGVRAASATGRGFSGLLDSRIGRAAVIGTAGLAGVGSVVGPAARDASFEAMLGDPDADVAFTGRKMSARTLIGADMGGVAGGALQLSSPGDFAATHATIPMPGPNTLGITAAASAGAGTYGAYRGMKAGKSIKGKIAGGILGGALGAALPPTLAASATLLGAKNYVGNNRQFFSESPYAANSSLATASALNANGDIVLGMHNARRGY